MQKINLLALLAIFLLCYSASFANNVVVADTKALSDAVKRAKPGDTVFLKDKVWKNAALIVNGKGTAKQPIVVMPQTIGKVFFSGQSFLKIAGDFIVIKGFHFKNGFTPEREVVSFRLNNDQLANNCTITEFVIENYSQPERFKNDVWIVLWGKNNKIDHSVFVDKLNSGPVIIAELNDERSQRNNHVISYNYFKGRQRFGSNGGETIRIGVSRYSLTPSQTQITHNYFERCNGEVEIISIKSGENNISSNTFFECEGSLVLRHGSNNVIKHNLFLGNNKPFTGGVRVINPGHIVRNNIFKDLKGSAFRSSLAVMNGVPNSLINRYYQVEDATIEQNTFINCDFILFGAGKDAERTLGPKNVSFKNNLITSNTKTEIDDTNKDGGILLINNVLADGGNLLLPSGFTKVKLGDQQLKGGYPYLKRFGANIDSMALITKSQVGANWYNPEVEIKPRKNKSFAIIPSSAKKINEVIKTTIAGDTIIFTDAVNYQLESELLVDKPLVFTAAANLVSKPVLVNSSFKTLPSFITIVNGGSLKVKGLAFKGNFESYGDVQCGIRSTEQPMNMHYKVFIDQCEFYDYNESSFSGFRGSKSTLADSLVITNSLFRNISGSGVNLAEERDDKGAYGAEYVIIKNCIFSNILGSAINIYRGGNDESTLGPFVEIDYCTFNEVENREQGTVVKLVGVQQASVLNSNFFNSGQGGRSIEFREFRWDKLKVDYSNFYNAGRIDSFYDKVKGKQIYNIKPSFVDTLNYNFKLIDGSQLSNKSSSAKSIGASL